MSVNPRAMNRNTADSITSLAEGVGHGGVIVLLAARGVSGGVLDDQVFADAAEHVVGAGAVALEADGRDEIDPPGHVLQRDAVAGE